MRTILFLVPPLLATLKKLWSWMAMSRVQIVQETDGRNSIRVCTFFLTSLASC